MPSRRLLRAGALTATGALLFVACGSLGGPPPPASPPKIVFQATARDFGRVEQGTKVVHAFPFENAGGLDLTIDNVRASCGCTAEATAPRTVAPGKRGTIQVSYDTARDRGHLTRTVTVYSNDPATPVATLTLVGDVDTDVAAEPPQLYLGHLRAGQAAPNELRIVVARAVGVNLGPVKTSGKVLEAGLREPSGERTRLAIRIKKDAPVGRFTEALLVRTSSTRQPVVTVPVSGIVDPPSVGAAPERK